jgi:protein required for attachment to host cells
MSPLILVADESEARFYDAVAVDAPLRLIDRVADPDARLHDRDLKSDRPGRVFDHAPPRSGRRGAVAHHSTGGENGPRKHAAVVFARQIAARLEAARRSGDFEQLIVVAGPPFLGTLRAALPRALRIRVVREVPKDLVHESEHSLRAHLAASSR